MEFRLHIIEDFVFIINMNTKNIAIAGIVVIIVIVGGWFFLVKNPEQPSDDEAAVRSVVVQFGSALKNVSLLSGNARDQIQQHYSPYVAPELLAQWKENLSKSPGRLASSPWPDRIEIDSLKKQSNGAYTGTGGIIYITGADSDASLKTPVDFVVEKRREGGSVSWRISSFNMQLNQTSFVVQGIIAKSGPKWHLTPKGGSSEELDLSGINLANIFLYSGQTVKIEGTKTGNIIKVSKIEVVNAAKGDLIWVASPLPAQAGVPSQIVQSPLTVTGRARGNWYFEADFPVKLLDANGSILAQAPAQAQGNWMTTEYVPFSATLNFSKPSGSTGTLVLEKNNPSGLPENADELRIPVKFQTATRAIKLYYYNPNNDKDASGNVLCSNKGLVAVDRNIPVSQTPIQDTVALLIGGELTQQEKSDGITTEYPLQGLELKGATLQGGVLTLEFADPQKKTTGGSCRVSILWKQIEATAKQFSGISQVKFKPETLFQP